MNKPAAFLHEHEEPGRFSIDEFMAMADAGAFELFAGKIELVDGVIVRMSPAHTPHFWHQRELFLKLHALFGEGRDGWIVGQEPTVRLGDVTLRDPDVAILRLPEHIERVIFDAANVLLVAEVSDSSLSKDRGAKQISYAKAMIPYYWIVDITGRCVELMSEPDHGEYKVVRKLTFGEPLPVPGTNETITLG